MKCILHNFCDVLYSPLWGKNSFFWLKSQKSDEIQNVGCLYTKTGTSETYCFKALSGSEEEEDQVWNFPHTVTINQCHPNCLDRVWRRRAWSGRCLQVTPGLVHCCTQSLCHLGSEIDDIQTSMQRWSSGQLTTPGPASPSTSSRTSHSWTDTSRSLTMSTYILPDFTPFFECFIYEHWNDRFSYSRRHSAVGVRFNPFLPKKNLTLKNFVLLCKLQWMDLLLDLILTTEYRFFFPAFIIMGF